MVGCGPAPAPASPSESLAISLGRGGHQHGALLVGECEADVGDGEGAALGGHRLTGLIIKALLEHDIVLTVARDSHPEGVDA